MGCLSTDARRRIVNAVRNGIPISKVAEVFGVTRNTVKKWVRRAKHPGKGSFRNISESLIQ